MVILHGLGGMAALLALAFALSEDRRAVPVRAVVAGIALQFALALLFVDAPPVVAFVLWLADGVESLQKATDAGTTFVFGYLGGGPPPFAEAHPESSFILAFRAFPLVLTISALAALLFHWGILQRIVAAFAWLLRKTAGIGGALGIGAAVHIFVGMVEAPLLVRPYLKTMSRGELFALMSCGMAGVAGTVMVIYGTILGPIVPDALHHILIASIISTPAALAVAALMVPFQADPKEEAHIVIDDPPANSMEAIARGTSDGIVMLANMIAMLIVIIALVTLLNMVLALLPLPGGALTLQRIFAYAFQPVMWLIGIPGNQTAVAAQLMGTKTVLNEFVAYVDFSKLPADALDAHSRLIMTYALCGFANFGSLGIMVGGMVAMAPERRHDILGLGLRSILSGTIATCLSGAVIGML
jgi:CNT family concentrative nucleoside transporter